MRYGEVVQQLLEEQGISQRELGRRSGVSPQHINRLISGSLKQPTLSIAFKIADGFGMTLDEMRTRMEEDEDASLEDSGEC